MNEKEIELKRKDSEEEKYKKVIEDLLNRTPKTDVSDWEFLDQILDEDIKDEPVPFPYGRPAY